MIEELYFDLKSLNSELAERTLRYAIIYLEKLNNNEKQENNNKNIKQTNKKFKHKKKTMKKCTHQKKQK